MILHGPDAFASGIGAVPLGKQKRAGVYFSHLGFRNDFEKSGGFESLNHCDCSSPFLFGGESRSRGKPDPCFSKGDAQEVNIPLEKCEILCKVPLEKCDELLYFPLEKCNFQGVNFLLLWWRSILKH